MARRKMAPWEEITYFDNPKVSFFGNTAGGEWVLIAPANPQRVALIMSTTGTSCLSPDDTLPFAGGIPLNAYSPYITITEAQFGSLCTSAWYSYSTELANLTVIEVILREMPQENL